jgi:hypothetical protein
MRVTLPESASAASLTGGAAVNFLECRMNDFANTANANRAQAGDHKGEHEKFIAAWLDQVRRDRELSGNAFNVAYEIAIHVNRKTREAWPSQPTITANTAVSESAVKRMIGKLCAHGHLQVKSGRGRGRSSRYRLVIKAEKGSEENPFKGEKGSEENPFKGAEKGPDRGSKPEKRVQSEQEKGPQVDPDLLKDLGERKRSPKGRERNASLREDGPPAAAPNGAASGFEESKDAVKEDAPSAEDPVKDPAEETTAVEFAKLLALYQRDHAGDSSKIYTAAAVKEYTAARHAGVTHATIMAGAQKWVEAYREGQDVGFLPRLPDWLACRQWAREPWQQVRAKRKAVAQHGSKSGNRKGKPDLASIMMATE